MKSPVVFIFALGAAFAAGAVVLNHNSQPVAPQAIQTSAMSDSATNNAQPRETTTDPHRLSIPKAADGQYWLETRVNATNVKFLIDTGASVVSLTPKDAQRLGLNLESLKYDHKVQTAHGVTEAAEVKIDTIDIGGVALHDVRAMVIREGLEQSLLGMSALERLRRFDATPSSLVLHP